MHSETQNILNKKKKIDFRLTKKAGLKQGEVVSKATKNLLRDWDCDQNIVGMVFDTTASNTGHISGA